MSFTNNPFENGQTMSEEARAEAQGTLDRLRREKQKVREPRAASLGFTYLTDTGYEGFSYDEADGGPPPTSPMSVLLHTGADPIGVFAYRNWIRTVDDYVRLSEQLGNVLSQLEAWWNPEEEAELFTRISFACLPSSSTRLCAGRSFPP